MNRFRFLLVVLCTLALATVASAGSPIDITSAGSYCDKLCSIGFHCVATPDGGVCVPGNGIAEATPEGGVCVPGNGVAEATPTDPIEVVAAGAFCNKLCSIGFHCVATPDGGVCVPGNGVVEGTPTGSTEKTEVRG